jgi:hemoglobin-like flavoprotein
MKPEFRRSPSRRTIITMTPDQKRLVRHTWDQVAPMAEAAADMFYRLLFEIDPATRKLFRATEMVAQRKKLLQTLSFAINGLDDIDGLASKVEDLGRRHAGYGVTDAQYDSVGAALLWTLSKVSAPRGRPRSHRRGPKSTPCCPVSCAPRQRASRSPRQNEWRFVRPVRYEAAASYVSRS